MSMEEKVTEMFKRMAEMAEQTALLTKKFTEQDELIQTLQKEKEVVEQKLAESLAESKQAGPTLSQQPEAADKVRADTIKEAKKHVPVLELNDEKLYRQFCYRIANVMTLLPNVEKLLRTVQPVEKVTIVKKESQSVVTSLVPTAAWVELSESEASSFYIWLITKLGQSCSNLHQQIRNIFFRANIVQLNPPRLNHLSNEVIFDVDVLCSVLTDCIFRKVLCCLIVDV
jgi:hypothetical protein